MAAQRSRDRHGEAAKIAATLGSFAVLLVGFDLITYVGTGDGLAFVASLPIALAAAAVVGSWFSAIRLSEAEERERDVVQAAEPIPHARVVIAHG